MKGGRNLDAELFVNQIVMDKFRAAHVQCPAGHLIDSTIALQRSE